MNADSAPLNTSVLSAEGKTTSSLFSADMDLDRPLLLELADVDMDIGIESSSFLSGSASLADGGNVGGLDHHAVEEITCSSQVRGFFGFERPEEQKLTLVEPEPAETDRQLPSTAHKNSISVCCGLLESNHGYDYWAMGRFGDVMMRCLFENLNTSLPVLCIGPEVRYFARVADVGFTVCSIADANSAKAIELLNIARQRGIDRRVYHLSDDQAKEMNFRAMVITGVKSVEALRLLCSPSFLDRCERRVFCFWGGAFSALGEDVQRITAFVNDSGMVLSTYSEGSQVMFVMSPMSAAKKS